jgi:hypothetical protein
MLMYGFIFDIHYFCEPFTTYVTLFSLVNLVIV